MGGRLSSHESKSRGKRAQIEAGRRQDRGERRRRLQGSPTTLFSPPLSSLPLFPSSQIASNFDAALAREVQVRRAIRSRAPFPRTQFPPALFFLMCVFPSHALPSHPRAHCLPHACDVQLATWRSRQHHTRQKSGEADAIRITVRLNGRLDRLNAV